MSGTRFWGWARDRFGTAERFFDRVFVANWCPLVLMDGSGRNCTPDKLPSEERASLFRACDDALARIVDVLRPTLVVGIGRFAERRAREALGAGTCIGSIPHPSPASPAANRGLGRSRRRAAARARIRPTRDSVGTCGAQTSVELMLLTTILLWSLNLSVTKYILDNGLEPLSYATARYALAGAIFVALTLVAQRTLRIERRHVPVLLLTAVLLWLNQVCFVLALDATSASTIGLLIGTIPIFAALFGVALGHERLGRRFWAAAAISSVGVALVAVGAGGDVSGGYWAGSSSGS